MKRLLFTVIAAALLCTACGVSNDNEPDSTDQISESSAENISSNDLSIVEELSAVSSEVGGNDASDIANEGGDSMSSQKQLGGLSPEEALEYIKSKPDIVIVQVNTAVWKSEPGFSGALWIPHDEMAERCNEIPEGRPVILHCGAGVVSVPAYETLIEKRPDIPELSYIAGRPHEIMTEYNEWVKNN
ncbi:MAG: hypothetical protein NC299_13525 [Lachnospiraceae bacterium]|nr:hypothetical protein [Ruminococcus sp.]MCM1276356.1 hypothetical protein [Lachnospiraceae bacterium]